MVTVLKAKTLIDGTGNPPLPNPVVVIADSKIDRVAQDSSSISATVLRINPAGAAVKIELLAKDFGVPLNVVLAQERYVQLQLHTGEEVFVFPKRVRVFVQDFSI